MQAAGPAFEYSKYSGWPEIKESLMTGRIQAAYMLAPLVMDLTDKRIPLKIVSLGHRSGAVIMVRTDSANKSFKDLRGKRIAIPSRFAVDFLFLRKMLARRHEPERHPDHRDAAARHAYCAVRQGGRRLLHRRAVQAPPPSVLKATRAPCP
ncbi:ABC transporter substrate-binding protein [Massilia sp. B-10]|nr:ABC transporter substrate-binding protein [Massilia sp. B-10]